MKRDNVLDAIGQTPLVKINNFLPKDSPVNIYCKLEWLNPGGSVKDRTALGLIEKAEKEGTLKPGSTVVESTSGNLGIALAMVCAIKRYRFICVLDPKTPSSNINLLKSLGAEIDIVSETDETGGYQKPRIRRVNEIVSSTPDSINLDQYSNAAAREAHYHSTGPEIYDDLEGQIDVLVGAVSTGGHLCGTAQFLKEKIPDIAVIGVEPEGSAIFGGGYHPYKQNGTGLSFRPKNYIEEFVDIEKKVQDIDAFTMARQLAKKEGLLVGGSSGGVFHIALEHAKTLKKKSNIVVLFPDGATKYADNVFSDEWMEKNGFI